MPIRTYIVTFLLASIAYSAAIAQNISVRAAVQQDDIYVGNPFQFQLILEGVQEPGKADLTPLNVFQPHFVGQQDASSTSIRIYNGQKETNVTKRFVMAYQLVVAEPGEVTIPSVDVTINGADYRSNPLRINVLKPGATDAIDLEMEISETTCYVGQPVILTVRWYFRSDIDVGNFNLVIPVLQDTQHFTLDDPAEPAGRGGKVGVIEIPPYGKLVARQTAQQRGGKQFNVITISKVLLPQTTGQLTIPQAAANCEIAVQSSSSGRRDPFGFFSQREYRRFQARTDSLSLQIKPLPQQERPSDFNGLVGRYKITASAEPTQDVNIGDPILLRIAISGDYLQAATLPDIQAMPSFSDSFKFSGNNDAPKIENGQKVFTLTLRPQTDQVQQIPPIPLCFFDVDRGDYVTVHSDAIPLELMATRIVSVDDAVGRTMSPTGGTLKVLHEGIAANYQGPELFKNQRFTPVEALTQPVYLTLWLAPTLLLAGSILIRFCLAKNPQQLQQQRRAQAASRARRQLRQLTRHSKSGNDRRLNEVGDILRTYIGDRFDRSAHSLTARDCRDLLQTAQTDGDTVGQFCQWLEQCDAGRYAGSAAPVDGIEIENMEALILTLERNRK